MLEQQTMLKKSHTIFEGPIKTIFKTISLLILLLLLPVGLFLAMTNQEIRQQAAPLPEANLTLSPASATFVAKQNGRIEVLVDTQQQPISKIQLGVNIIGTLPRDLKFAPTQPDGWLVTTNTLSSTQSGLRLTLILEPNLNQDNTTFATTTAAVSVGTFTFTAPDAKSMQLIFDREFSQIWQAQTYKNILIAPIDYQYNFDPSIGSNPARLSLIKTTANVPSKNSTFPVEVRVSTGEQNIGEVKTLLTFDPQYLRVKDIQKNENVFSEYKNIQIDNQHGKVILTAKTKNGLVGESILVSRILFQALDESSKTQVTLEKNVETPSLGSEVLLLSSQAEGRNVLGQVVSLITPIDPETKPTLNFRDQQVSLWVVVGLGFLVTLLLVGMGVFLGYNRKTEYQHFPDHH